MRRNSRPSTSRPAESNTRLPKQIFLLLGLRPISPSRSRQAQSAPNQLRSAPTQKIRRTNSWSPPRLTPPSSRHIHERGLREFVRTGRRPQTSLGADPRTTRAPRRSRGCIASVRFALSLPAPTPSVESASYARRAGAALTPLDAADVGAPRWPEASAWAARRPQRSARGRRSRSAV